MFSQIQETHPLVIPLLSLAGVPTSEDYRYALV